MATQVPQQMNQSFSGFGSQRLHSQQLHHLKTPEKRSSVRASFQTSSSKSTQKNLLANHHNTSIQCTPTNTQPSPSIKATTSTPNRQAHHSRSKSYCGVAHYGIGSTNEIIITSKSRKSKLVKEEPIRSSPSMLLDVDKENAVNVNHPPSPISSSGIGAFQNLESVPTAPTLPALAAVKKSWQLNSPQKNSTPTKKRSTSCLTPSTPLSISTSLTTIREPLTMALTPKSRARYEGISGTHKFNAYSRINNIDAISICTSEDLGSEVWCGERKGIIAIFDTNTCKPVATIFEEKEKLYVSCMCPVGEFMWAGMADGSINIYNIKKRCLVKNLHGHIGTITDIVYLGNDVIASCSVDFSIRLWDSSSFTPKVNCIGMRSLWINSLCSVSGLLWSGSDDSLIRVWDTNTGLIVKEITHSPQLSKNKSVESIDSVESELMDVSKNKEVNAGVTQLSYCSKTNRVWSASRDCSVKIWNPTTFNCEHSINFPSYVNCMHIAGQYVWIATNKELSIWNVNDKSLVARFPVNGFVWCIETVGDRVWIACSDKSIRVYNINECGVIHMEKRHFHGSKRLSSEFIALDVKSPMASQQYDIFPIVNNDHNNIEEQPEEDDNDIKEINYDDFGPQFTGSKSTTEQEIFQQDSKTVIERDEILNMMQTEVLNISESEEELLRCNFSDINQETHQETISFPSIPIERGQPLQPPQSLQIETVSANQTVDANMFPRSPINECQKYENHSSKKVIFSHPLKEENFSRVSIEEQEEQCIHEQGVDNSSCESNVQSNSRPYMDRSSAVSTVKIERAVSEDHFNNFGRNKVHASEQGIEDEIELKECKPSPPSLSTPSSENCNSFSNGRLLFSDDVIDFEEPHHQSRGCSSFITNLFGNVWTCFLSRNNSK